MTNIIGYTRAIQKQLDRQTAEQAATGWMEENALQAVHNGGGVIKIPKIVFDETISNESKVTCAYEAYSLRMEKTKRFRFDAVDYSEEEIEDAIERALTEFQRLRVIPEIDAYRISALAKNASDTVAYACDIDTVLFVLSAQLVKMHITPDDASDYVILMSRPVYDAAVQANESEGVLGEKDFIKGGRKWRTKSINDVPIICVPSNRMKTDFVFDDIDGFAATKNAVSINWLICPRTAAIAVSKTNDIKITTPEQNLFADAWDVDYCKYHDVIILDSKKELIAICTEK